MSLPKHLFLTERGDLHDIRILNWTHNMVRPKYRYHHRDIRTVAQFKATLRAGAYAWPGGYPLYFITSDGAALSFAAAREEYRNIIQSISDRANDDWRIVACDVNYEDTELYCDHSNTRIPSAYGDDHDDN